MERSLQRQPHLSRVFDLANAERIICA